MKKFAFILMIVGMLIPHLFGQNQIVVGKSVQITIQGVPVEEKGRIDGNYPVSESGTVNMPFIGQVRAAGLRSDQLASAIQAGYRSAGIYTNPTIQVVGNTDEMMNDQMVHVGGQVRRTGPVKFTSGLTLYQAVQAAGGATEFGSMKRVKVYRAGNQRQYDLTQAQFMRVPLEANDTIEVPQKNVLGQ